MAHVRPEIPHRMVLSEADVLGITLRAGKPRSAAGRFAFHIPAQFRIRVIAADRERLHQTIVALYLNGLITPTQVIRSVSDDTLVKGIAVWIGHFPCSDCAEDRVERSPFAVNVVRANITARAD